MGKFYVRDIYWWSASGGLFLVFLILKLTGTTAWKWIWISSPLWICSVYLVFLVIVLYFAICFHLNQLKKRWGLQKKDN